MNIVGFLIVGSAQATGYFWFWRFQMLMDRLVLDWQLQKKTVEER
jgi:hypothetical protein